MTAFASRPVEVVEIIQPLCSRTFGVSPCNATGEKCWNTTKTCKFISALDLSESLALRFVQDDVYEWQDNDINLLAENGDVLTTERSPGILAVSDTLAGAAAVQGSTSTPTATWFDGNSRQVRSFIGNTNVATHFLQAGLGITPTVGVRYTYSVDVKPDGYTHLVIHNFGDRWGAGNFTLTGAGSVTQRNAGLSGTDPAFSITNIGNGVYRCAISFTWQATADNNVYLSPTPSSTFDFGTAQDGVSGLLFARQQIETGSVASAYDSGDPFLIDYLYQPALDIPALAGYKTAPTVLNVASGSKDKGPLGYRAVCNVRIKDFPWNDVGTDPYVSTRSYVPEKLGSFWTKWLARNPYHIGYTLNIYEGTIGQPLSAMTRREYVIEKIDHGKDGVSITAKDILRKVTDTAITAPYVSRGELSADVTSVATELTVAGAVISEYLEQGYLRINNEVMQYTQVSETSGGNLYFEGITRGVAGTAAAAHSQNDRVQRVIHYDNRPFYEILYDLFVTWGGIPARYIDFAAWAEEKNTFRPDYNFTAYLAEPAKIDELAGEVCLQALANVWWDERIQQIILKAVKPEPAPYLLSDDGAIVAGSLAIKEKPEERASQSHVYYLQRTPVPSVTEKTNYSRVAVFIDVNKQIQYGGEPQIRELFCRFIPTQAIANTLSQTYLERFSDVRREISFDLSAKDVENIWTGSVVSIRHYLDVDFTGAARDGEWLITSAEVARNGLTYRFTAEDNEKGGVLWSWLNDAGEDANGVAQPWRWLDNDGKDSGGTNQPYRWL